MSMKNYGYKLIFIGDYSVGKTSIINWFLNGGYSLNPPSTIGASFCSSSINVKGERLALSIWDTAGQERFRSLVRMYYRKSDVCICVFDVSNARSFDSLEYWIQDYKDNCIDSNDIVVIVANKCDLEWAINEEDIERIANKYNTGYFKTNCIDGLGIDDLFRYVGNNLLDIEPASEIYKQIIVKEKEDKTSKTFLCC